MNAHRTQPLGAVCRGFAIAVAVLGLSCHAPAAEETLVTVFDHASIHWDKTIADGAVDGDHSVFDTGHVVQATRSLPALPVNQRDARRIVANLVVEPELIEEGGVVRPGDPWTRLGSVSVVLPKPQAGSAKARSPGPGEAAVIDNEVEIMRFVTSFGGPMTYEQDVTALAPLLAGKTTLRASIATFKSPAWKLTLTLKYTPEGAGYRRPAWARPLFNSDSVTAATSRLKATIEVPAGVARPRLWITSTGHATDGIGGDEFISRTHVLRIDGREVARFRPWAESGGELRPVNPTSGRTQIDGRELWSSDLDRAGWHPGTLVQPLKIPLPELTPGTHEVEVEILDIRPKDAKGMGYWRTSAIAVADDVWPQENAPSQ